MRRVALAIGAVTALTLASISPTLAEIPHKLVGCPDDFAGPAPYGDSKVLVCVKEIYAPIREGKPILIQAVIIDPVPQPRDIIKH